MNLPGDSEAHHHDGLPGENIHSMLTVHAGGCNLDERRNIAVNRCGQGVHVRARSDEVIRESAVRIAAD
jgi:hypothetical protein